MEQDLQIAQLIKDKYAGKAPASLNTDLARLSRGEPLNYVIGWAPFLGCRIDLSGKPFIPRLETEWWVEQCIVAMQKRTQPLRALDLFAGSGCIGVGVLRQVPSASLCFVERSARYAAGIERTLELNGIAQARTQIIVGDALSSVSDSYDYILANPPYVATGSLVESVVLQYEPHEALFADSDGLGYIRPLISWAKAHLNSGGELWFEFDPSQKDTINRSLSECSYTTIEFSRDQYSRWRFVRAVR